MFIRYYFKKNIAYIMNKDIETTESVDVNKYSFISPKVDLDKEIIEGEVIDYVEPPTNNVVSETVNNEEVNNSDTVI